MGKKRTLRRRKAAATSQQSGLSPEEVNRQLSSYVMRNNQTGNIQRVVFPHGVQIGLDDSRYKSQTTLKGQALFEEGQRLQASNYINWGETSGAEGYGIRDNSGVMQKKNSDVNSWSNIGTVDGTGTANALAIWSDSDTLTSNPNLNYNPTLSITGTTKPQLRIVHTALTKFIEFYHDTSNVLTITPSADGHVLISGSNSANGPLVVKSNAHDPLFKVQGDGKVGILTDSPGAALGVRGVVSASLGFSGSLTRLASGASYLVAGTNVTIASASNGQVTVSAAGGSGSPGGSDTQIQYNDGGSFGGISAFTWDDTDLKIGSSVKLKFRDDALFVHSPDDGYLVVDADTRLALTGSGAVPNAISIITDNAAGGIDIDSGTSGYQNTSTGKIHLTSSLNSGDGSAIQMLASAGGIQIDAVGAAGEDITIRNTGGSINIVATETASDAINIDSSGGVDIDATGAIAVNAVGALGLDGTGGINIGTGTNVAVDINSTTLDIDATNAITIDGGGTFSIDGVGSSNVTTNGVLTLSGSTGLNISSHGGSIDVTSTQSNVILNGSQILILSGGSATSSDESSASDVTFYVSGSKGGVAVGRDGISVFGGDLVVSGSGQIRRGFEINADRGSADLIHFGSTATKEMIASIASTNQVLILSDTTAGEVSYSDLSFFVSGTIGSRDTSVRGTSIFGGDLITSGALVVRGNNTNGAYGGGISGSIHHTSRGLSYLVAGSNITVTSASNGQVTIASSGGGSPAGSNTQIQYNNAGSFGASSAFTFTGAEVELHEDSPKFILRRTDNSQNSDIRFKGASGYVGATVSLSGSASNDLVLSTHNGSTLTERVRVGSNASNVVVDVTGSLRSTLGLSGSLTQLANGASYLAAGANITIASASNGQVTISSTATGGGGSGDYQAKTANFTVGTSEYMFGISSASGHLTGTLPAAASAGAGKQYIFKDTGGYAGNTAKGIHIATDSNAEKIDGAASANILVNSGSITVMTDGSNWFVVGVA